MPSENDPDAPRPVTTATPDILYESALSSLRLLRRGKVRDIYAVDENHLLIVASDRLSAFDVVLPDPIPGKGAVLTALSNFWFRRTHGVVPNHLASLTLAQAVPDPAERAALEGRATVVKRVTPLPIEAIVRGYVIGSGWKDYQASGAICGIALPPGLRQADRLPEPIYTPSTKAEGDAHDENIPFERTVELLGAAVAARVREATLAIYAEAAAYAQARGIIIADTKLEFGLDESGRLILIDELLTPDSSRFWPADAYRPGTSPPSFDKQYVRDYLESLDWDKKPPAPRLPESVLRKTAEKYHEAQRRLMG
jgi:phosphoribosylaminoimidazole-succinocarboxamide synthase